MALDKPQVSIRSEVAGLATGPGAGHVSIRIQVPSTATKSPPLPLNPNPRCDQDRRPGPGHLPAGPQRGGHARVHGPRDLRGTVRAFAFCFCFCLFCLGGPVWCASGAICWTVGKGVWDIPLSPPPTPPPPPPIFPCSSSPWLLAGMTRRSTSTVSVRGSERGRSGGERRGEEVKSAVVFRCVWDHGRLHGRSLASTLFPKHPDPCHEHYPEPLPLP